MEMFEGHSCSHMLFKLDGSTFGNQSMLARLSWTLTDGTTNHAGSNESGSACPFLEVESGDILVGNINVTTWITTPVADPSGEAHEMIVGVGLQVLRMSKGTIESWACGLTSSTKTYVFPVDGKVLVGLFGASSAHIAGWGTGIVHLGFFVRDEQYGQVTKPFLMI